MAGIYVHIPFCIKICPYCDFFKSGSLKTKEEILDALNRELEEQHSFLGNQKIETIYFGGGTPSVLEPREINTILETVYRVYHPVTNPEITLEANPDDLTTDYVNKLSQTAVNRLSIGCQSFNTEDLNFLQRRHNASQSENSIVTAQKAGFDNISIDLIYGLPQHNVSKLAKSVKTALSLSVQHISAYHLTIEPNTLFFKWQEKGKIQPIEEEKSNELFEYLIDQTNTAGFVHYEISSFGKEGYFSKHNCNYWKQVPYLGIGPSAHSYNGRIRRWNIRSNKKYLQYMAHNKPYFSQEILTDSEQYNDYILTSLRTMWGADLQYIENNFSKEMYDYCMNMAGKYINYGLLHQENNHLKLTKQGKFVADNIMSELFFLE